MSNLTEGQELKSFYMDQGQTYFEKGKNGVAKIEVIMEFGQMALVPWFCVTRDDGKESQYNAALVEGVELSLPN